jgi:hypothetical protein
MLAVSCIALDGKVRRREFHDGVSAWKRSGRLRFAGIDFRMNSIPMYAGGREVRTAGI